MIDRAFYQVTVGGQDISAVLRPILITMSVTDKKGTTSDACEIEIDDTGGLVVMPEIGAEMQVVGGMVGGAIDQLFKGKVDEVKSKGSRGSGRTLSISAKGLDTKGKGKQNQTRHMDNMTLENALREAGREAGISNVRVAPQLRSIMRDYWGMDAESFIHFGERIAREVGGVFKIRGSEAIMALDGSGESVGGQKLPTVTATWGDNLIDWDIAPQMGRSRYRETRVRFFNRATGQWEQTLAQVPTEGAEASTTRRHSAANRGEAQRNTTADSANADKNKGGGRVTINGNVTAKPEGKLVIVGARPGVDGEYLIEGVEHNFGRSGFTTRLELKKPGGKAGKDSRRSRSSRASGGGASP